MSKKSYNSMSVASRNADNFIRTYNKQLEKAYRTLGAESTVYKNLIGNTRNMEVRYNKDGIAQLSRSKANIEKYNANNAVRQLKSRYYADTEKKVVNPRYNVQSAINTHIKTLKQRNINPTAKEIKALSKLDEIVSNIFENYENMGDRRLVMSDKIKELSDALKDTQDSYNNAYDRIKKFLDKNPKLNDVMKNVTNINTVDFGELQDGDFDTDINELFSDRRFKF